MKKDSIRGRFMLAIYMSCMLSSCDEKNVASSGIKPKDENSIYKEKSNKKTTDFSEKIKYFESDSSEFEMMMRKKYAEIHSLSGDELVDFINDKTLYGVTTMTDKLLLVAALTKFADEKPEEALNYFTANKHISDDYTITNLFLDYLSNGGMKVTDYVNKISELIAVSKSSNFKTNAFLSCVKIIDQPETIALIKKFALKSPYELRASSFFSRLASTDPYIALSVLEGLEMDERSKNYAYGDIYEQLSLTDPKGAFEKIISSNSSDMESVSLTDVCLNWLKINPTEAFKEIKNLDAIKFLGVISNPAVSKMLADSNADVNDIFKIIESVPLTQTNMSQIEKAVMFATPKDHSVVFDYIENLPISEYKNKLLSSAYGAYAKEHPSKVFEELLSIQHSKSAAIVAESITKSLAISNTQDILDCFSRTGDENTKKAIADSLIAVLSAKSAQKAISLLNDESISGSMSPSVRNSALANISTQLTQDNLQKGLAWLGSLSEADSTPATQGLVATWMKTDPIAASEWLSQQPAGSARDAGAQEIINQIKDTDPEMAEQWRKSMTPK